MMNRDDYARVAMATWEHIRTWFAEHPPATTILVTAIVTALVVGYLLR